MAERSRARSDRRLLRRDGDADSRLRGEALSRARCKFDSPGVRREAPGTSPRRAHRGEAALDRPDRRPDDLRTAVLVPAAPPRDRAPTKELGALRGGLRRPLARRRRRRQRRGTSSWRSGRIATDERDLTGPSVSRPTAAPGSAGAARRMRGGDEGIRTPDLL